MADPFILRIIAGPAGAVLAPSWLMAYDVDAYGGTGFVELTPNPEYALQFPDELAVMAAMGSTSRVKPVRPDGLPNRPLAAFTVMVDRWITEDS